MSPYRVLIVCTGNICRSPFAERLLRARLNERFGSAASAVEVSSAGTFGLVGEPMMPEAAEVLVRYGGDPMSFAACALEPAQVEAADLVLGLTREHRAAVATMVPEALSYTLTLRQYARLASGVAPADVAAAGPDLAERFRALTLAALGQRGSVPIAAPADDDVPDPFGQSMSAYEAAAVMIDEALERPLSLLAG